MPASNMTSKPVSQIGRISNAPPPSRNVGTANTLQSDTEGVKPRSMLPQPGQNRYNTRSSILPGPWEPEVEDKSRSSSDVPLPPNAATPVQKSQTPGTASGKLQPRSMYQNGTPSSQLAGQGDKAGSRSMRPPASLTKSAEASKMGLGPSQSLQKPATASQISQPSGLGGHARTQSTSTIATARREIAKPASASERPKSLLAAPSRSSKTSTPSVDTLPSTSRTSARTIGLARLGSTRVKSDAPAASAGSAAASKLQDSSTAQTRRKEPTIEEPKKTSRPAFTTLQQHFTPRKAGKAPTSTFINPAPQPASNSLPPEIASLQSELLQLHLLHQPSAEVSRSWEQSAKRALHTKFDEVSSLHQVMLENERAGQEQKNLQSLLEWSTGSSTGGLVEQVQILSEPLHELPSLVEPGGRLQRLVAEFEQWMSWVQEIRSARQGNAGSDKALGTIQGLGDASKMEAAALIRKLTVFARDLEKLAPPTPGSSIASMVDASMSILRGILDELQTMQKIQVEVVAREKLWVQDRLRTIARDVDTHVLDAGRETAAWRD